MALFPQDFSEHRFLNYFGETGMFIIVNCEFRSILHQIDPVFVCMALKKLNHLPISLFHRYKYVITLHFLVNTFYILLLQMFCDGICATFSPLGREMQLKLT